MTERIKKKKRPLVLTEGIVATHVTESKDYFTQGPKGDV